MLGRYGWLCTGRNSRARADRTAAPRQRGNLLSASDATSTPSPLPRTFWFLAGSGTIGALGAGAMSGVLPLLASAVTSDPLMITVVAAASYLPWLALSLYIGVLVDRWDRVRLLRAALLTSAAATLALAGLVASGLAELWVLVAAALVLGTAEVLIGNSFQSLLGCLVPLGQLTPRGVFLG